MSLQISESKLQIGVEPKVNINLKGFQNPISTPTEASKGGVLLYIADGLNFKPRNDLKIYKSKELESAFVEIINPNEANSIIGVIYKHPCIHGDIFNDDYLKPLLEKLSTQSNKKLFITGDFNFDLIKASTHKETADFFNSMTSNFLLPLITLPTKINTHIDTLIDNIFTNQFNPDFRTGNLTIGISDHLPSFMIVPKNNQNHLSKKHNLYRRDISKFNKENFLYDFLHINWNKAVEINKNDVNRSFNNFMEKTNNILDKHMPYKKVSNKEFKNKYKPWVNKEIIKSIYEKNKLFKKYMKCKNITRKNILFTEYKKCKNDILKATRFSKKLFFQDYFTKNNKNMKKIWEGIKQIVNIKSKNFNQPSCLINKENTLTDPIEIANTFNDYFSSIADNLLSERKYSGNTSFRDFLKNPLPNSFVIRPCDEIEVKALIQQLEQGKSLGPNSIPTSILKLLQNEISVPLSQIFNLSFSSGTYPEKLRTSKTIPIFKKGSRLTACNYRPISLLSNLNKILEKLMFSRVYKFIEKYNCIYELQFGFREKHSTNHALINITETIRSALDNNKTVYGIFVDLQKAFDTVNHEILIEKLQHYGIRGKTNDWFKSYLTNRKQFVSINGYDSDVRLLRHGVPQGSVLGPLLFILYINDLRFAIKHSNVYHFADDTNLLHINDSHKKTRKYLNFDLKNLHKWLLANKISLNCDKTQLIIFHKTRTKLPDKLNIKLNGILLNHTHSIKYLGVFLDETLSGDQHCFELSKILARANGILAKARHYAPEELKSMYHALFSSHINYGSQIWGLTNNAYTQKIFLLQKAALRIITFSEFRANTSPLFKENKILKFKDRVTLENCLFVYDFLKKQLPRCFDDYFKTLKEVYPNLSTRNSKSGCLFIPPSKTTKYGLNSLKRNAINAWNFFTRTFRDKQIINEQVINNNSADLLQFSRTELKNKIMTYYINSY